MFKFPKHGSQKQRLAAIATIKKCLYGYSYLPKNHEVILKLQKELEDVQFHYDVDRLYPENKKAPKDKMGWTL